MSNKNSNPKEIIIKKLAELAPKTQDDLGKLKRRVAKQFRISVPSNIDLLKTYHNLLENKRVRKSRTLENLLKTRPVRSLSGIVNISVVTKPYPCPGKCIFCPAEEGLPKSYVSGEPAVERARALKFDAYLQTKKRIEMLEAQGHPTEKIELRIVGGTWSFYPKQYQTRFIKKCFFACNQNQRKIKTVASISRCSLKEVQRKNERAKNRIVGVSIETRPDFITEKEILRLRKLGVTLIEMGVQTVLDGVLKRCQTGFTAQKIAQATRLLKDSGFKVLYQMMPGLPDSSAKKDLEALRLILEDGRFKPDWLKIYPCVVCKNTLIYQWWKRNKFRPYSEKELIALLLSMKQILPYWIRLTRLMRDIPAQKIVAGCKTSNLREVVQQKMRSKNLRCRCIRCREIGKRYHSKEKTYLYREDYRASGGKEIFLSFENKKRTKLFSLLRLRIPSFVFQNYKTNKSAVNAVKNSSSLLRLIPVLRGAAIIREIQTFGPQLPISEKEHLLSPQHKGLGKRLIREAEEITKKEWGLKKMAVTSGIGVRGYYRSLGYRLKQTYMIKRL